MRFACACGKADCGDGKALLDERQGAACVDTVSRGFIRSDVSFLANIRILEALMGSSRYLRAASRQLRVAARTALEVPPASSTEAFVRSVPGLSHTKASV